MLICGAGPVGLVLALWLQRFQVPFRIIDKAPAPGLASRALIVQSRILEYYRQLGIVDRIIAAGNKFGALYLTGNGRVKGKLILDDAGRDCSKYPYSFVLPQDIHEKILEEILMEQGVKIERNVELMNVTQSPENVQVTMKNLQNDTQETITVEYLAGCDGARSFVRKAAGIRMEGGTYGKRFYVADVHIDPSTPMLVPPESANMNLSPSDFCMLIPFEDRGNCRMVGYVPEQLADKKDVTFEDIEQRASKVTRLKYNGAAWFSTYNLHHRVASHFRTGRIFLCGDACHLHSPTGGQGMNAGIVDATNLAWKLASVLINSAPASILDTYEPERQAFAKLLVSTTDMIFSWISGSTMIGWFFRSAILSYVVPFMMKFAVMRKNMFLMVSQLKVAYPQSSLSRNVLNMTKGKALAGDRLPWIDGDDKLPDNHDSLAICSWQVHVYGDVKRDFVKSLQEQGLPLNVYPWSPRTKLAGLVEDAVYLLRPDGHIGCISSQIDAPALWQYARDSGATRIQSSRDREMPR